ncbi:MAG TPA: PKD domain-containing protein, partial [Acidimicrobiia bacterium]
MVNALGQHVRQQYFACTGRVQSMRDQNDIAASRPGSTVSWDLMNRPLTLRFPDGGQTYLTYGDANHFSVARAIDDIFATRTELEVDAYGRPSRIARANGDNTFDIVDVCYDLMGRVAFQSYPYRSSDLQAPKVCAGAGERIQYDALGRVASRTHSDGSSVQYTYRGRATRVTEEGNGAYARTRVLQTDALGQLTQVCEVTSQTAVDGEVPIDCGLDIAATGFLTTYGYDALGGLTRVQQGRLAARTYTYDSLGRLTSEFEPEAGSRTTYQYDRDGLLLGRVRPAPNQSNPDVTVTTTYAYDAAHRLTSRTYSDATPAATFSYDDSSVASLPLNNTIGRLTAAGTQQSSQALTREALTYDPVGRISTSYQWTSVGTQPSPFQQGFGYDFAGSLRFATNPAGVQFNYSYDDARRLTGLSSSANDANHPPFLLGNVQYGPFGPTSATIAGRLNEQVTYTPQGRLQTYAVTAPANPPTVAVTPSSVQLQPSQSQQFVGSCTQGGSPCPQGVTWTATAGSITASGFYTAPSSVPSQTVATITACWAFSPEVCASAQATITPVAVDQPPVARISVSCNGLMCAFDAGTSSDDHGINSYLWTFGDGGFGIQRVSPHTYAAAGTYTVQLTVYDTINQSNTATTTLTVTAPDTPPTPFFTFSCTGRECTFDGRGSTDDHGITAWAWSFGDTTTGSGSFTSHTYAVDGTYTVQLTVTDTSGQVGFTTRTV